MYVSLSRFFLLPGSISTFPEVDPYRCFCEIKTAWITINCVKHGNNWLSIIIYHFFSKYWQFQLIFFNFWYSLEYLIIVYNIHINTILYLTLSWKCLMLLFFWPSSSLLLAQAMISLSTIGLPSGFNLSKKTWYKKIVAGPYFFRFPMWFHSQYAIAYSFLPK